MEPRSRGIKMGSVQTGETINGRYRILRQLGEGAMGTVFLCEDLTRVRRKVALKILRSDRLEDSEEWSKVEYEALTRLRHPNLARVHDFGRIQESHDWFIVSEFIRGDDLLGASTSFEEAEFLDVVVQICRALEYIHSQGYVHFDIKPDNILVTRTRQLGSDQTSKVVQDGPTDGSTDRCLGPPVAKLIDFGLAEKITGTFDFAIKGTLHYVAPEIIDGGTPDRRADLYSFGVSLYQILAGRLPFVAPDGTTVGRVEGRWKEDLRRDLSGEHPWLIEIILRLLEKDPEKRFSTAREIIQAVSAGAGRHWQVETAETQISYLHSNRLIGRRFELEHLRDGVERGTGLALREGGEERTVDRSRPLLLVSGEIGIGKSRLLDEFAHHLKLREIPFFTGHCLEAGQEAYQPFRTILEQMSLSVGLDSDLYKENASLLQRVCPRLQDPDQQQERGHSFDPMGSQLIDQLALFIERCSEEKPCVVVLNNLHWADDSTVNLLQRLSERVLKEESASRLLLVLTMRDDDQKSPVLKEFLEKNSEAGTVDELALKRFGRPQIAELIQHVLQVDAVPSNFLDRLEERTAGNPLFIVEMLKVLQEEGIIFRDSDGWSIRGGGELSRVELPAGIHQVLHRRVRVLQEGTRSLLRLLALHGRPAPVKLLESVEGFKETLRDDLRELDARGMVSRSLDSGRPTYAIMQPKLQEIICRDIPPAEARRLHGLLAEGLESYHGEDLSPVHEELSFHYQRSDRPEKALNHLLAAGEAMQEIHAHDKALEHYQQALERLESAELQLLEHLAVWEKIGDVSILLGRHDLATESFQKVVSQPVDAEVRNVETDLYRIRALRKLGKIDEILGDYPAALRWLRESADMVMRLDSDFRDQEQHRVLGSLAWIHHCTGDHEKAMSISAEGISLLGEADSSSERAQFLTTIGHASHSRGEFDQAIDYHQKALDIFEGLEDSPGIIRTLNAITASQLAAGHVDEALSLIDQVQQATEETGDQAGRAMCFHLNASALLRCGDLEEALRQIKASAEISTQLNMRFLRNRNHFLRGKIRRRAGDFEEAESDLLRAFGVYARGGKGSWLIECMVELCWLHLDRSDSTKAKEILAKVHQIEGIASHPVMELEVSHLENSIELMEGRDPEEVLARWESLEKQARDRSALEIRIRLLSQIAELQVEVRKLDEARQSYRLCDRLHQAFSESLPGPLRPRYLSSQKVATQLEGGHEVPEVNTGEEDVEEKDLESDQAKESLDSQSQDSAVDEFYAVELMRVSRLLAEASALPMPRVLIPKSLSALVRALDGEQGWLLTRKGDAIHVACGVDGHGQTLKSHQERIALPLVEEIWNSGKSLTTHRIVDEPRTQTLECLYRTGVKGLCVVPLKTDGQIRALLYITDPEVSRLESGEGKAVLDAHCGLMGFLLPRANPVSTKS
ncbi:MAG: hypothetical protein CBC13_11330 [Planctomycetia bacterium TMED53]|nr:MAG: hypothetical protein CBC13_11330 [Planctomycetia bacterium TMED53]